MKKIFLAVCFIACSVSFATAKVAEVHDASMVPQPQIPQNQSQTEVIPVTAGVLGEFLQERLEKTVIQEADKVTSGGIFVEPSPQLKAAEEEINKPFFQKVYEQAMQRAVNIPTEPSGREDLNANPAGASETYQQQQAEWNQPNFPVINAYLPPDNHRVIVPAREHIPYLMTHIEILPDGLVKFEEIVTVVANGEKLRRGLTKVLPKFIYSRNKDNRRLDYTLIKVTANDQEIPYKIVEKSENIWLVPIEQYILEPGVYTYKFEYIVNRLLWDYQDFREFYWDISGSAWNLVIARANATIMLPPGIQPLGQEIYTGYPQKLSDQNINLFQPAPNTWGYVVKSPLFIGEGFHIIMSLPENTVTPPGLGKKLVNFMDQSGDIVIALMALAVIWGSFVISWFYIKSNRGQLKFNLKKNAVMLRYLAFNKFDKTSFASFILELYRKNIIDIQQADSTILLIKRTDNLQSLSRTEQKALRQLFSNDEAVFKVSSANRLKVTRATDFLRQDLYEKLRNYLLKSNSGYLLFSFGMLLLAELFMAMFKVNIWNSWVILGASTLFAGAGMLLFSRKDAKKWQNLLSKCSGLALIILSLLTMMAVVTPLTAVVVIFTLFVIHYYTSAYAQRGGLLKNQIDETMGLRQRLLERKDDILMGKEVFNQQPSILALDLSEQFPRPERVAEYYKLDIVEEMLRKLFS